MVNNRVRASSKLSLAGSKLHDCVYDLFTYSTVRSATIQSLRVGIVYRCVQLAILAYIIFLELIYNKGYQIHETVSSVVTTKVKGQGFVPNDLRLQKYTNGSYLNFYEKLFELNSITNYKALDTADYIVPPNEYNSIFIMTNFIETYQIRGICDEEYKKNKATCTTDDDCKNLGSVTFSWNGIPTGRCVQSSYKSDLKVCEINAWCPHENDYDVKDDNIVRNVLNYTIFIKNDIEFKKFHKKERNILKNITNKYISRCLYEDQKDPYCPVFQLNYVLSKAEANETEKYLMLLKGGVILIDIIWNCDYDFNDSCYPKYTFTRFDVPFKETSTASGFNFRFANKFKVGNTEHRMLYKAFGLRFIINVSGTAGKFNILPLMLTIGAGIGLMSISVLIADCVLLHFTKEKKLFQKMKEIDVKESINLTEVTHIARI